MASRRRGYGAGRGRRRWTRQGRLHLGQCAFHGGRQRAYRIGAGLAGRVRHAQHPAGGLPVASAPVQVGQPQREPQPVRVGAAVRPPERRVRPGEQRAGPGGLAPVGVQQRQVRPGQPDGPPGRAVLAGRTVEHPPVQPFGRGQFAARVRDHGQRGERLDGRRVLLPQPPGALGREGRRDGVRVVPVAQLVADFGEHPAGGQHGERVGGSGWSGLAGEDVRQRRRERLRVGAQLGQRVGQFGAGAGEVPPLAQRGRGSKPFRERYRGWRHVPEPTVR